MFFAIVNTYEDVCTLSWEKKSLFIGKSFLGCEIVAAFRLQIKNAAGVFSKQFSFERENVLY